MDNRSSQRVKMRELQALFVFISLLVSAEAVTSFIDPRYGLFLHSVILLSVLALSTFRFSENPSSKLFLSLSLAPLIRIVSLSLPLVYFPRYAWYLVAGVPVLLAALMMMRVQGVRLADAGVTLKNPLIQFYIALSGVDFGIVEFFILRPEPLAPGLSVEELVLLAGTLILFTGFVEELVFRGILQTAAVGAFGRKAAVVAVTAVFAALHIGWLSILDMVFVLFIGLFLGYCALETGSIVGVSLSHGITNVFLFLVMPWINLISIL